MKFLSTLMALASFFVFQDVFGQCTPYANAIPGITLQCAAGATNRSAVAYNPIKNLYYSVNAGNPTFPMETFDDTGLFLSTVGPGADYRGFWWNPNLNQAEGNGYNTIGIMVQSLDPTTGYAINGATNVLSANQPNAQSVGDYDYNNDEIIYYDAGVIYKKDRATNSNQGSVTVTGLPAPLANLNGNTVLYIGCPGREYGLYDVVDKRLYYVDLTGAYVDQSQLPLTAPGITTFRLSFTNNLLWIYDSGALLWNSYQCFLPCPAPVISLSGVENIDCYGDSTGSATASATGGSGPYIFVWSNNDTAISVNNLPVGTHTVTVIDNAACASDTVFTLTESPELTTSISSTDVTCFGDASGSSTVTASGGIGNYSYNWSSGGNVAIEAGLAAGTHFVSVTDSLNCTTIDTATILQPDSLAVWVDSIKNATCENGNDGAIYTTTTGGVIPYVYLWDDPNNQTFANAANLEEGTYSATVTDGDGCTVTNTASVGHIFPAPVVSLGPNINSTFNFVDLNAPTGFSNYIWSNGSNSSSQRVFEGGVYSVTVTDDNGCTGTSSITVTLWVTGIEDHDQAINITTYPNPSTGNVTISVEGLTQNDLHLEVTDVLGQVVSNVRIVAQSGKQLHDLDLSNYPDGVYLLRFESEGQSATQRLILQR